MALGISREELNEIRQEMDGLRSEIVKLKNQLHFVVGRMSKKDRVAFDQAQFRDYDLTNGEGKEVG